MKAAYRSLIRWSSLNSGRRLCRRSASSLFFLARAFLILRSCTLRSLGCKNYQPFLLL